MSDSNEPVASYAADLLYTETPLLTQNELLEALTERVGAVDPEDGGRAGAFLFKFPDLADPAREGGQPVGCAIERGDGPLDDDAIARALAQSRDWREAGNAAHSHEARLVVSDRRAAGLGYKNRLRIFQDVVAAVSACATPCAILWRASGKLVNPLALTRAPKPGEKRDLLQSAVAVRRLPPPSGGAKMAIDTLGLHAFGLPDLECVVRLEDPAKVESFLLSIARYVFDLGDVLPDGKVVKGATGDRYILKRTRASAVPSREVLALRPASDVPPTGNTVVTRAPLG
jgi:hypothetical protein